MAFQIARFEETPNPNALKLILDQPISEGPKSYRAPSEAGGDALAESLFAVEGVAGLLMNGDWMTVNKTPDASWKSVKAGVKRALEQAS